MYYRIGVFYYSMWFTFKIEDNEAAANRCLESLKKEYPRERFEVIDPCGCPLGWEAKWEETGF